MLARLVLAAACLGAAAAPAAADLIVTVGSATVTAGGTVTVDVHITGSDLADLDYFLATFTITADSGVTPGGLAFTDPQSVDFTADSAYVFAGRSGGLSRGVTGGVLTVGDFADPSGTPTAGQPGTLLARLELQATAPTGVGATSVANQYRVELDLGQSDFQDAFGGGLAVSGSSTLSGTVTVVPEPGVVTLLVLGAAGPFLIRQLGRKTGRVAGAAGDDFGRPA